MENGCTFAHPTYGGGVKEDASLRDEQLEGEIRLVGDLVLAASQREGHLSQAEIDAVLGLDPDPADDDRVDDLPPSGADDVVPPGSKAS